MQAQAPLAPYVGLWTCLHGFAPDELSALTGQRQVVRLHLMRNTVHLVSARDCLDWRTLFYPMHAADFRAHFRHGIGGVDRDALLRQAARLLAERPRTRSELGNGMWQGTWQIPGQCLRIQPFTTLPPADRDALLAEAAQLCAFVFPQASCDIVIGEP
jgi:Winged helix DNA-binding domain